MPKSNSNQNNVSNLQDNYSTPTINLTEEPTMYEPMNNRRYGVTKKYHHNNKKHYVNVQYDTKALPRVVRIFSDSKYGTEYADMCIDLSHDITERLQTYGNPETSLKRMASQTPRKSTGEPTTIKGLIVDELIKSYYLED